MIETAPPDSRCKQREAAARKIWKWVGRAFLTLSMLLVVFCVFAVHRIYDGLDARTNQQRAAVNITVRPAHRTTRLFVSSDQVIFSLVTAARHIQLITIDDYLAGELRSKVKHEYAGGHIYAMAGASNVHNTIAGAFFGLLFAHLRGRPCQPFNSDTKVRVRMATHNRFYYPDAMVVCTPNPTSDTFQDRPVILAEVISKATRRIDEGEKRDAYLTIPELSAYLLIETSSPRVVVYHRTDSGFVPRQYEGLEAVVPLDAVKAQLSLAELYERVDFSTPDEEDEEEDQLTS